MTATFGEQVQDLECHFSWNLTREIESSYTDVLENKLKSEIEGNPDVKIKSYLLLSYAFTVKDKADQYDLDKALNYVNLVFDEQHDGGEECVAKANRLNILQMKRDPAASMEALNEVQNMDKSDDVSASIALIEAYALSLFHRSNFVKAKLLCEKAIELCPNWGEAHFTYALHLGRIRRQTYGNRSPCDQMELSVLRKAMELWNSSPLPLVFYALAISHDLYNFERKQQTLTEMHTYLEKATKLAIDKQHATALMRCSKAYRYMARCLKQNSYEYSRLQEQAIQNALRLCPDNSNVLHEASLCYWKSSPRLRDLDKAEHYLIRACDPRTGVHGNVFADIDLVRIRIERDNNFNALEAYTKLLPKHQHDAKSRQFIHIEMGKEFLYREDATKAYEEFKMAIEREQINDQSKKFLTPVVARFVKKMINRCEDSSKHKNTCVQSLLKIADIYALFELKESESLYHKILGLDKDNTAAHAGLRNIREQQKIGSEAPELNRELQRLSLCESNVDQVHASPFAIKIDSSFVEPCSESFYSQHKDSEDVYKMTSNPRGLAIVINITKKRDGSERDEAIIEQLFTGLLYFVVIQRDKTRGEIMEYLNGVRDTFPTAHNSIVVFCMAHGQKDEIFDVKGKPIKYNEIFDIFRSDNCPSLRGKPKLYFIQACRGVQQDTQCSVQEVLEEEADVECGVETSPAIPVATHADMIISFSTVDGHKAYRDISGTRYVKALVKIFREHAKDKHVCELLTKVNNELQTMSGQYREFDRNSGGFQFNLQCAEKTDTLTKNLYFFPGF